MIALVVDRKPAHGIERIAHRFPHGRVGVNGCGHIVERGFQAERGYRLSNNFRGKWSNRMDTEYFAVFRIGNHFDKAFMLAENRGLTVAQEREFADLNVKTSFARLLLRITNRPDLRLTV